MSRSGCGIQIVGGKKRVQAKEHLIGLSLVSPPQNHIDLIDVFPMSQGDVLIPRHG